MHVTYGAFTFPFVFLVTDLTVRLFGANLARRVIRTVMIPALMTSYALSILFDQGQYQGLKTLTVWNSFAGRIAIASFLAYFVGQILDITVFNRLRQLKQWWIAPSASTILGNLIDTLIFFFVAFYHGQNNYMSDHWFDFAWVDYGYKIIISSLFFLPLYGMILSKITQYLNQSTLFPEQAFMGETAH